MKNTNCCIIAGMLTLFIFASCHDKSKPDDCYPKDLKISDINGIPKDSTTLYFPFSIDCNGSKTLIEADSFRYHCVSKTLYKFQEPILYNFYSGTDVIRILWSRAFHELELLVLKRSNETVSLTIKEIEVQMDTSEIVYDKPRAIPCDLPATMIVNETIILSITEWNHVVSVLDGCNFWAMKPIEEGVSNSEARSCLLEAHLQDKYWFVTRRKSRETCLTECAEYLIELSGRKY